MVNSVTICQTGSCLGLQKRIPLILDNKGSYSESPESSYCGIMFFYKIFRDFFKDLVLINFEVILVPPVGSSALIRSSRCV